MEELVNVDAVSRRFALDNGPTRHPHSFVSALWDASLRVSAGEFLAIAGPSGSGKSTLLNLIGCIDQPTAGRILIAGVDTSKLNASRMTALRREKIGFVFQTFNLIPVFTAAENVEFPLLVQGIGRSERRARVAEALDSVGLSARADHRPDLLSGGERQRVAVPAPSCIVLPWCWPTSRPRISTRTTPRKSSTSCTASTTASVSPSSSPRTMPGCWSTRRGSFVSATAR